MPGPLRIFIQIASSRPQNLKDLKALLLAVFMMLCLNILLRPPSAVSGAPRRRSKDGRPKHQGLQISAGARGSPSPQRWVMTFSS